MRVHREIDPVHRVVTLGVSGELDDEGLLSLAAELRKDPEVNPDFAFLIDLRETSGKAVTTDGVRALIAQPLVLSPRIQTRGRRAQRPGYGMARMYEMLREDRGGSARAFRDFDEAPRWVTSRD